MDEMKLEDNKSAIAIVAHPDDETIWMGGTIARNKKIAWTIFSLCRASDRDRAPKFKRVCEHYGAKSIIADLDDEGKLSLQEAKQKTKKIILEKIAFNKFDYIFTHGANGEYGHERHIAVYLAIDELIKAGKIKPETVFYFNYKKNKDNSLKPGSNSVINQLSEKELLEKKRVVAEMYGYLPGGIDVGYCTNPEAFLNLETHNS
ncbi:MAG: PIG-L family deacetylase [Patescibacteria group bacterium]|nr:PIG-L family deacetylase [Patescibacteria group bacterium]